MSARPPVRRLPVRPDLEQLKHQAKDLLRAIRRQDPEALANLRDFHPSPPAPEDAKLADAQLTLARSYGAPNWARVAVSCRLIEAIWENDIAVVKKLVSDNPALIHENAGIRGENWGPPLSYASNLGRDEIITLLHSMGAKDLEHGIDRAVLQGRIDTAKLLHRLLGSPRPPAGSLGGPAYTLNIAGTAYLFEIGVEMRDAQGNPDAPVDVVLESDGRRPDAKHRILEMYADHGFALPDTPMMALHRGRLDLLEQHLRRDPALLSRTFSLDEIYPPSMKCHPYETGSYDEKLPRTPIAGSTLLHVAIEYDELELARWLLDRGMDANVRAAVDENGFGGHTPLFNAVVSYPNFWMNFTGGWAHTRKPMQATFAELLLSRGANPNARASFREPLPATAGVPFRDHRDVTPLAWGKAFANKMIVSEPALRVVEQHGGHE